MDDSTLDLKAFRALLSPYAHPSTRRAVIQLIDTALPFVLFWALMVKSLSVSYALTLALSVPTGFLFIRLFILQHDCGHGSFFPSRTANHVVGSLLGIVTLFPYGYWRRTHAIHHATSGNLERRELGDVKTYTVREYKAFSRIHRWLYALYRHPLVLLGLGPAYQFVLKHRFPFDLPWSWKREWASVMWTNAGIAVVFGSLSWWLGWRAVLFVHLPVVLVAGAVGVFLFYVQHQFEDTYWEHDNGWDFYRAAVRPEQPDEVLDEHALADARRTDDEEHLAVLNIEAHSAQHVLGAERLLDVAEGNHRGAAVDVIPRLAARPFTA